MADHVLSILVKAVGASQAAKDIGKVDGAITKIGGRAKVGLKTAAANIGSLGLVAGGLLGAAIKTGIDDLAALENATTKVDGAIKQMGQSGKVTSAQVAAWANQIESDIGAAFDDKAITSATATLIRFGAVTPTNLHNAMTVMTDLAAKTGDVDSAATLLAKALADPEKAAGKLARTGVVLTKVQQENIKALVKAGKTEQAQAMLLDLIATKTKGAAAATQGPYQRALSTLHDVAEDAGKALAEGFLPVLERVATFLKGKLADPKTLADIRGFGVGLADAFDKVLSLAGQVPWDSIAGAMKLSGIAAKGILDAFTAMPPWVQTAIVTGWGLNKLTGGAVTGIIGEIGKGLIKGVLGMNAGVVNINAGVVNGGGGLPGAAGAAAGGGGALGAAKTGIQFVLPIAVGILIANAIREAAGITPEQAADQNSKGQFGPRSPGNAKATQDVKDKAAIDQLALVKLQEQNIAAAQVHTTERLEALLGPLQLKQDAAKAAIVAADAHEQSALNRAVAAGNATAAAAKNAGYMSAAAIRAKDLSVKTYINLMNKVTVNYKDMVKASVSYGQYQKSYSGAAKPS